MTTDTIETEIDYSKMKWCCVVKGGYCSGVPEWEIEPVGSGSGLFSSGVCKLDPETCGKYKSSQQVWDELPQEEKDRVSKPSYKEMQMRDGGAIEISEKPQPKSKKAKKLEGEIAQRSMF